eukprot:452675-Rhodomonas_salina.2
MPVSVVPVCPFEPLKGVLRGYVKEIRSLRAALELQDQVLPAYASPTPCFVLRKRPVLRAPYAVICTEKACGATRALHLLPHMVAIALPFQAQRSYLWRRCLGVVDRATTLIAPLTPLLIITLASPLSLPPSLPSSLPPSFLSPSPSPSPSPSRSLPFLPLSSLQDRGDGAGEGREGEARREHLPALKEQHRRRRFPISARWSRPRRHRHRRRAHAAQDY